MGISHSKKNKSDLIKTNTTLQNKLGKLENELKYIKSLQFSQINNNVISKLDTSFENIIFEGGGIKGIAYCGALQRLNELGLLKHINRFCGSSIGAICACLLSIGYSSTELETIIKNTNFNDFIDNEIGYIHDYYNLLNNYGYCSGNYLYNWIGSLIQQKVGTADYTFNDVWTNHQIELIITGTNLNNMTTQFYSYKNNPNMIIRDAIRITMSIPFVFSPVQWDNDILVDGGISNKYPLQIFDKKDDNNVNWKTIGLKLDSLNDATINNSIQNKYTIDSLQSFNYSLVNTMYNQTEQQYLIDNTWLRSIIINTGEIEAIQFDLTDSQKQYLINQGRLAVNNFIQNRKNIKKSKINKKKS